MITIVIIALSSQAFLANVATDEFYRPFSLMIRHSIKVSAKACTKSQTIIRFLQETMRDLILINKNSSALAGLYGVSKQTSKVNSKLINMEN